ncbi:iron-containing alcohol dehydrogenase [Aliiruegeria sabulilitoris]|uniref:iron-containing alcohol dehydrogenase n=1 Tax=Aliiruegeria sabulilitoris TaxID=1510458 RepID=UPI000833DFDB|nr:iron-containing alcohol dehydrogenase [Aliiruegeria sabulilitoris]NDR59724.1 iron-containing alcohol dehydrogenase [Pseudoruegeria sp. M32A2M]
MTARPTSFAFATATEILFGRGKARETVPALAALGERIMVVCGADAGRAAWLCDALEAEGRHVLRFQVPGEPDMDLIDAGVSAARAAAVDAVIALGGGAAIDAGKAIAALVPSERPMLDHLEVVGRGLPLEAAPLPFAAIPTTAGTGTEVTRNAVISVPEARRKVSLRDLAMLPRLAIVDPALTDGCPRGVTLASGLDAITQVMEPYLCTRANPLTDALCRDAIPAGLAALPRLMAGEDPEARDAMAWVSLCGGLALANAGLGVIHGLAGPLGGLSGAAHGAICGALLPHGLALNAARAKDTEVQRRFDEIRGWIASAIPAAEGDAFGALATWSTRCGLPGLDALGVSAEDRAAAAEAAATSSSMKANPVALTVSELKAMMEAAR